VPLAGKIRGESVGAFKDTVFTPKSKELLSETSELVIECGESTELIVSSAMRKVFLLEFRSE